MARFTLYLVRHGEVYNPEDILYGRLPNYFLSDTGRMQAEATSMALQSKSVTTIYASPMERAQQTAQIIAKPHRFDVFTDERLNECHTPYDGQPHSELAKTNHDLYTGNEPPYETVRDLRVRLQDFIQEMRKKHAGEAVIGVTHGDIVVSAFMMAMQQDENDIGRGRLVELGLPEQYPATAAIHELVYETDDTDEVPAYRYMRPY